jgi:acyl-CoA thioesterase YciA
LQLLKKVLKPETPGAPVPDVIKPPSGEPSIRVVMLPKDTNPDGDIFGGVILSMIDLAADVEAQRQARHRYVTVAMDSIQFHQPARVGDIVSLWCRTEKIGRSSISIHVDVRAKPRGSEDEQKVTEAIVTLVAINQDYRPIPILD